jgi:predicted nucleic acid-binding protein
MYLLDTNVISELRRARPDGAVLAWLQAVPPGALHLSAASIGEMQAGIEITRERDAERAEAIEHWLGQVVQSFEVLAMDARAFRVWAPLMHRQSNDLLVDAMIAATAIVHNLTVVTRNVREFELLGVPTLNPFEVKR